MKIFLKTNPNTIPKHLGFDYQLQAFNSLKNNEYGAIFHEQGLGKTKIAIDIFLYWFEIKTVDTVLIVVKKTLLHNWLIELKEHCNIKPAILSQDKKQNFHVFNGDFRLILMNYELMKSEYERLNLFLKARDVGVILDESTKIKNPKADLTKLFLNISPLFKKRLILTGTPIANRPYDIWSQIYFLDQGNSLGKDFDSFRYNLDLDNSLAEDKIRKNAFEIELEGLFKKISRFTIRETKNSGIINLPDKIYENIITEWESIQYDKYRSVREETRITVIKDGLPLEDISENVLKRLLRLVQISSNPLLIDKSYDAEPGKLPYLKDLVSKIVCSGEKCIIWTGFIENVDWLAFTLKEYGTSKVTGKMDIFQRTRQIERFKTDQKTSLLIATPGAAKEGLTLTVANHVIFFDRSFSPDDYLQAQDRIHRISQKRTCYIYNLIMKDSVDEWIDLLLKAKILAARLAQGDISPEYYKKNISYNYSEVLKNILGMNEEGKS